MPKFELDSAFSPTADQPAAIESLAAGIESGERFQTLLGATGTGKTMTMAATIETVQRPSLIIAHNKTLAAQLYSEFREFFPKNAVEYFVSYYDYYQPEAYVPSSDTYIEKDSSINEELERLRMSATSSLVSRRDVIVVASVSCIYGLGSPRDFTELRIQIRRGAAAACCAHRHPATRARRCTTPTRRRSRRGARTPRRSRRGAGGRSPS